MLECDARRNHIARCFMNIVQGVELRLVARHAVVGEIHRFEFSEAAPRGYQELLGFDPGTDGDKHRDDDARHGRMDSRCQNSEPDSDGENEIDAAAADADCPRARDQQHENACDRQRAEFQVRGIEKSNDQHGTDVVRDRERGEENLQTDGRAAAK